MKPFNKIVEEVFKLPEAQVKDSLSSEDIPDWDSMNYLFFIAELEKHYGVSFSMDEVMNAKTLGDLRSIIDVRGRKS
jgi:acyl carrier protein